jgi:membrane associated rhomboid family serine protease
MFGRRVEGVLYIDRYLLLVALAALIGDIAHIVFDPHSYRGVIGASGGISGILAYYCLSFPKAEVRIFFFFTWIRLSVVWFFFFWILWQSIGAMAQASGFGSVSFLAHLGGSIVGFAFWYVIVRPKRLKKAKW